MGISAKTVLKRAGKNIEIFLKSLEKYDERSDISEDDFIDELHCELELNKGDYSEKDILGYIKGIEKESIRKDLTYKFNKVKNEKQIKLELVNRFKKMKLESDNGFMLLRLREKYEIISQRVREVGEFLGNDDIYFSKRFNENGVLIPLRKDAIRYVYRIYEKNMRNLRRKSR